MPKNMSISVNGQSQVPPGFRFHPTEEELLNYYLKKKVAYERIDLDVIRDVDLNKLEPWDIQEKCKIGSTPQNDWYFFSHKDKKYPTGTRTNRATAVGFWKATGRDKVIHSNGRRIGMRKTLVFYKGRAPRGQKSDWIMHEYRLDDNTTDTSLASTGTGEATQEEGWVVCRIFKKKNFNRNLTSTMAEETRSLIMLNSCNEGSLEQILETHMGRTWKEENEANNNIWDHDRFTKLPTLECPNSTSSRNCYQPVHAEDHEASLTNHVNYHMGTTLTNWAALDRLVASQLNGQTESSRQLNCFNVEPNMVYNTPTGTDHVLQMPQLQHNISEWELWNFTRSSSSSYLLSSSDPLCHVSEAL